MLTELARQYQATGQEGESLARALWRSSTPTTTVASTTSCRAPGTRTWTRWANRCRFVRAGPAPCCRSRGSSWTRSTARCGAQAGGRRRRSPMAGPEQCLLDDMSPRRACSAPWRRRPGGPHDRHRARGVALQSGRLAADVWDSKYAAPTFQPGPLPRVGAAGLPVQVHARDRRAPGQADRAYWHREVIDAQRWTIYQDAEVSAASEPEWREDAALSAEHGLGFVPAIGSHRRARAVRLRRHRGVGAVRRPDRRGELHRVARWVARCSTTSIRRRS